jgi:hypothetical protein
MEEVKPTGELAKLLLQYKSMGGIIDFVIAKPDDWTIPIDDLHKAAAIFTIEVLNQREQVYYKEYVTPEYPYLQASEYSLTYEPDKIEGQRISISEFLGPFFDLETKQLLVRSNRALLTKEEWKLPREMRQLVRRENAEEHLREYFFALSEEKVEDTVIFERSKKSKYATQGFAQAFSDPPFGLQGYRASTFSDSTFSSAELNSLFISIVTQLFDLFGGVPTLFQWSDEWSTYFDEGKDFWGSFMWTVQNTNREYIVGVAVSGSTSVTAMNKYKDRLPRKSDKQ